MKPQGMVMRFLDNLKGYRTLIFNVASLVVLIGTYLTGSVTDGETLRIIAIVVSGANMLLRMMTDTPVGKSA